MMVPPKFNVLRKRLIYATVLSLAALWAAHLVTAPGAPKRPGQRLMAAGIVLRAQQMILAEKQRRQVVVDPRLDPAGTGIIGPKYTLLVTEASTLRVKRTAANPNMAAIVVRLLHKVKVKSGDPVAICCTGSLPGINLAALAAVQSMRAQPTTIVSLGASMFGATDPAFTWLDMSTFLQQQKLLAPNCIAATPGGLADSARGLPTETLDLMRAIAKRNNVAFFIPGSLDEGVLYRMKLLQEAQHGLPKALIFVGGGVSGYGTRKNSVMCKGPIVRPSLAPKMDPQGLIYRMLKMGVAVIALHSIEDLAKQYGLPVDPTTPVSLGEPPQLYGVKRPSLIPLGAIVLILLLGLGLILRMGPVSPSCDSVPVQPGCCNAPATEGDDTRTTKD